MDDQTVAHVPRGLVWDYDVYRPAPDGTDVLAAIAQLKADAPAVFWTPRNGGHWVITDSVLARRVLSNASGFSSRYLIVPRAANPQGPGFIPINMDPPAHTKYRIHLSLALSRKGMGNMADGIRAFCIELIEGLRPLGRCEFISEFALHLPIRVFLRLVDLPEQDRLPLLDQVARMIRPGGDKHATIASLMAYLSPVVRARRAAPEADLISWLSMREVDGAAMSEADLLSMCTLLLIGGLDSVANTLGMIACFLAENPEHRQQLVENPELIPAAVLELLRRFPTVQAGTGRAVVADIELGGVKLKAGDQVMIPTAVMNLGAAEYPRPLDVDFRRRVPQLGTFGFGAHTCPGATLARTEIAIFLEEWLKRIPTFSLAAGERPRFVPGVNISLDQIRLVWQNVDQAA